MIRTTYLTGMILQLLDTGQKKTTTTYLKGLTNYHIVVI